MIPGISPFLSLFLPGYSGFCGIFSVNSGFLKIVSVSLSFSGKIRYNLPCQELT
jgi:hypothetical protein